MILKLFFKALHFPDLSLKLYSVQAGVGKRRALCSYLCVIIVIMNRELSPVKKKGNNMGRDYNIQHFLICVRSSLVSCLLNMFLNGVIIIEENYDKLSSAI